MIHVVVSLIHGSIFDSLLESRLYPAHVPPEGPPAALVYLSLEYRPGTFKPLAVRFSKIFFAFGEPPSWPRNARPEGGRIPSKESAYLPLLDPGIDAGDAGSGRRLLC